ncbi:DUF4397 domain-containing protein [Halorientalis pallida]|uniref:DUF4397 domain-containing protein n=1 Tax=Halorientalis pallida TaxID=2479928 RepID=UPI003C6F95C4
MGTGTAAVAGLSGTASARFGDDEDEDDPAEVRVIHASPDAPAVDVFVGGNPVLEDVPFKTVSDYLELDPGSYDVAVAPAGAGAGSAVIDTEVTVEADTDYTVAATGRLADIQATVLVDDNDDDFPPLPRVRVVHLSPDAPAVDVVKDTFFGDLDLVEDLEFRGQSEYLDLPPLEYDLSILPAGGDESVFDFSADTDVGATYTAFAVGLLEPPEDADDQAFDVVLAEDVAPLSERFGRKKRGR